MKSKILYFLGFLLMVYSCKQEKAILKESNPKQVNKVELLVQKVLDMKGMQAPLLLINDSPDSELFIAKHDSFGITENLELEKFNKKIKILDYNDAKRDSIVNIIYFENFDVSEDRATVKLFYVIEGIGCDAKFVFKNNNWEEISSDFWYD
jgi:hypothetical protein